MHYLLFYSVVHLDKILDFLFLFFFFKKQVMLMLGKTRGFNSCIKLGRVDGAPRLPLLVPQTHRDGAPPEPHKHPVTACQAAIICCNLLS